MSRARASCRGSRVTVFFQFFFFSEKVIIDAINVIKTNKKNLKFREKLRDIPICFRRITYTDTPETNTTNRTRYLKTMIFK